MRKKVKVFTLCRKQSYVDKAALIGFACWVAMENQMKRELKLMDVRAWIVPAINHQQILFFFDDFDRPIGYIIWANLAPDTEQRLLKAPDFALHDAEWDEGRRTWIIDCCFLEGRAGDAEPEIHRLLKAEGIDKIFWTRRDENNVVKAIIENVLR